MLIEVPGIKTGKAYISHSEEPGNSLLLYDAEQQRHLTLLFIILSYLFMRGSDTPNQTKTSEGNISFLFVIKKIKYIYSLLEELLQFLSSLRVKFDEYHPYFGSSLKKLVTETFVKQLYLKREKVVSELESETK